MKPTLLILTLAALAAAPVTAQEATADGAAEAQAQADIEEEMLLGYWSDNGDCSSGMLIRANYTFHSFRTGDDGSWQLEGNVLRLTYAAGMQELELLQVDQDVVVVAEEDGSVGHSYRCETTPPDPGARPLIPIA